MRFFLMFTLFFASICLDGQDTIPAKKPYELMTEIPLFRLKSVKDSLDVQKYDLPENVQVLFFLFSPNCPHCQTEAINLMAKIEKFKKVQIIFASVAEFADIKKFYYDFKLDQAKNIICGKDISRMLFPFYKLHTTPTIVLYNKKGVFNKIWEGSIPMKELIKEIK